jgi:predicted nucleotidyltransferase
MAIEHLRASAPGFSAVQPRAATWVDEICGQVAARLTPIEGIKAVALGGSRARGTAREDSDIDLALYYDPREPFAIEALDAAARDLDDRHVGGLVTPFGAWGAGVNGGGWLCIGARPVDLLYRDLRRVRAVIEQCVRGEIDAAYQLGHPLGFQNQIYAGEMHVCQPLYDPAAELAALKRLVALYPPRMRRALVDKHLFDAQFEIEIAAGPAARGDVVYVSQCLARAAGFMVLVLHALNERFFLNEKNAFIESGSFALRPHDFHREAERILARPGNSTATLTRSIAAMRAVASDLRGLCDERYPPDPGAERGAEARQQLTARFERPAEDKTNT